MIISTLLSKHTDGRQAYQPVYNEFFTDEFCKNVKAILEIGIGRGAGLEAWLKLFPTATVFGLDIRIPEMKDDPRLILRNGDSTLKDADWFLEFYPETLEVIVDDGDHQPHCQLSTLMNFYPHLSDGGIYVMEDTGPRTPDDPFVQEIQEICKNGTVYCRPVNNISGVIVIKKNVTQPH